MAAPEFCGVSGVPSASVSVAVVGRGAAIGGAGGDDDAISESDPSVVAALFRTVEVALPPAVGVAVADFEAEIEDDDDCGVGCCDEAFRCSESVCSSSDTRTLSPLDVPVSESDNTS